MRSALGRRDGALELRNDPTSLAPDRVIVFEIAGTVANFLKAVGKINGLEFMAEYEGEFTADDDFAVQDGRKGKEGEDRTDKAVGSCFYLAMPDVSALEQLLSLWGRWERGETMEAGFTPFAHLFAQLHALRAWGAQDRIPEETMAFWRDEAARRPGQPVRTEVELWYHDRENRRRASFQQLSALVVGVGGRIVHEAVIPDIAYHGALIDIPASEVQRLIDHTTVSLALADDVMFLRPQSMLLVPIEVEPGVDATVGDVNGLPAAGDPVAALLDGMPVQHHALLVNRLRLDDPDNLESRATVSRRIHGTAMASLILHGDRNEDGGVLSRPLYVRPLMITNNNGHEHTEADRLLVDTLYRAVVRIKGSEAEVATAPTVFLINIAIGDARRPFTRLVSPLARLIDFLSVRYNVLFIVSGGNVSDLLEIPGFADWTTFEAAAPNDRERAVVAALNAAKHERTIISPAEALNALTIGAQHHDNVAMRQGAHNAVDPFADNSLPNVSSGLGLGYHRMIKPEVYFPGGREYVQMRSSGNGLKVATGAPQRLYGLKAAAPDPSGQGRLDYTALSDGTSSATALATRAAHRIFDALMDRDGGSMLSDMDPQFYAVVVKCLLVHRAKWNGNHDFLKEICGPDDKRRFIERGENACRFIGFGVPDVKEVLECEANRATLVGYGAILPDSAQSYRIPLPECLERVTDPRSLTVTLAWFSPIKAGHQRYRCVRMEAAPLHPPVQVLGVERLKGQPADVSVKRGSIFHEHFHGAAAVPFIEDGHLSLQVWCKEDAGAADSDSIRYGIAVTIEAETALPVYDEIQARLRVRPRPGA
ncbi:MAG: S8 family peptidase [Acidiferrobacterales bacterium]